MAFNEKAWHVGFKWTIGDEDNPTGAICLDDSSDALHICEIKDARTDWNVSSLSHPTLYIHSATTPETDYIAMYHDGDAAYLTVDGTTLLTMTTTSLAIAVATTLSGDLDLTTNDIMFDTGGVINWNDGDVTITHSSNLLTVGGGNLHLSASGKISFNSPTGAYIQSSTVNQLYLHALGTGTDAIALETGAGGGIKLYGYLGLKVTNTSAAAEGQMWMHDTSNSVKYYGGGAVKTVASLEIAETFTAYKAFSGGIRIATDQKAEFGGTGVFLQSTTVNQLHVYAAGTGTDAVAFETGAGGGIKLYGFLGLLVTGTVAAAEGQMWYDSSSNKVHYWDGTAEQTILDLSGGTLTGALTCGTTLGVTGIATFGSHVALGNDDELRMGDNAEFYFHVINANSMRLTPSATGKVFTFGQNTLGMNVYFYSETSGRRMMWDAVNEQLVFTNAHILLGDMDYLYFGGGNDFHMHFDAANMWMVPSSLAVPLSFGTNGAGCNVYFNSDTSGARMLWDADNLYLTFMGTSGLLLPVRTSGIQTQGSIWLDTTDQKIHFWDNTGERTVTSG